MGIHHVRRLEAAAAFGAEGQHVEAVVEVALAATGVAEDPLARSALRAVDTDAARTGHIHNPEASHRSNCSTIQ